LLRTLTPIAARRTLLAQTDVFFAGERAHCYYLVVLGELLAVRQSARSYPAVRFMTAGDLFILDCDGGHFASCHAVLDSVLACIDRRRLHRLAQCDPALMRVLHSVHTAELEMILQGLGSEPGARAQRDLNAPLLREGREQQALDAPIQRMDCRGGQSGIGDPVPGVAGIEGLGRGSRHLAVATYANSRYANRMRNAQSERAARQEEIGDVR